MSQAMPKPNWELLLLWKKKTGTGVQNLLHSLHSLENDNKLKHYTLNEEALLEGLKILFWSP